MHDRRRCNIAKQASLLVLVILPLATTLHNFQPGQPTSGLPKWWAFFQTSVAAHASPAIPAKGRLVFSLELCYISPPAKLTRGRLNSSMVLLLMLPLAMQARGWAAPPCCCISYSHWLCTPAPACSCCMYSNWPRQLGTRLLPAYCCCTCSHWPCQPTARLLLTSCSCISSSLAMPTSSSAAPSQQLLHLPHLLLLLLSHC